LTYMEPFLPYLFVCLIAIILDCLSAWDLARRVNLTYPNKAKGKKFTSQGAMKIFETILKISLVIWLLYMMDHTLFPDWEMHLAQVASGVFCACQVLSILENISSCNGARWAKLLQKIVVDKTNRHLNIDLSDEVKTTTKKTKKADEND